MRGYCKLFSSLFLGKTVSPGPDDFASVIPFVIIRFIYLSRSLRSSDQTYTDFNAAIMTETHVNLSVIVSCIPFLKPVTDSLQTGALASNIHTSSFRKPSPYNRSHRFALNSFKRNRSEPISHDTQTSMRRKSNEILCTQEWSVEKV